jgi:predicted PolB exonuclease-like 3'-5' exonuclease
MSILHFDLETIPSQKPGALESIRETIKHPGNISKAETVAKWYEENADSAAMEQYRKQSFDGALGEIISIAWALDDGEVQVSYRGMDSNITEAQLLASFFNQLNNLVDKYGQKEHISTWSGHYITGFDLRFIWQRCVMNGIRPLVHLPYDAKPWDSKVFDTKIAWTGLGQSSGIGSLDALSKAFGLEGKGDIDGSKVYDYWVAGRIEEIAEYNKQDVEKCRALYNKMNFIG